jgi:uncharacterized protein YcbK (DUF882 family)
MPTYVENTHILVSEFACHCCGALPVDLYNDEKELGPEFFLLFKIYEEIRAARGGGPLAVISGYRCRDYEKALYDVSLTPGGHFAAKGFISVHPFGLALDLGGKDRADQENIVKIARTMKPTPRIGWKTYQQAGQTTVHIDLGFLIMPRYSKDLQRGVEW